MTDKELLSWMKLNYDKFNKTYFNKALPNNVKMKLSTAKSRVGYAQYKVLSNNTCEYSIFISKYFSMPEKELENVLLHEMIHISEYYFYPEIFKNAHRSHKPHGEYFIKEMNRLNRFGHNITIKATSNDIKYSDYAKNKLKEKYLFLLVKRNGENLGFKLPKKFSKEEINAMFEYFADCDDKKYIIETDYGRFASVRGSKRKYWILPDTLLKEIMDNENSKILIEK